MKRAEREAEAARHFKLAAERIGKMLDAEGRGAHGEAEIHKSRAMGELAKAVTLGTAAQLRRYTQLRGQV